MFRVVNFGRGEESFLIKSWQFSDSFSHSPSFYIHTQKHIHIHTYICNVHVYIYLYIHICANMCIHPHTELVSNHPKKKNKRGQVTWLCPRGNIIGKCAKEIMWPHLRWKSSSKTNHSKLWVGLCIPCENYCVFQIKTVQLRKTKNLNDQM